MRKKKILKYVEDYIPEEQIYLADGFEEAFLGIGQQFNNFFAVYDKNKCIEILAKDMSYEEAEEYFSYNVVGAYLGNSTPVFIDKIV